MSENNPTIDVTIQKMRQNEIDQLNYWTKYRSCNKMQEKEKGIKQAIKDHEDLRNLELLVAKASEDCNMEYKRISLNLYHQELSKWNAN